MDAGNILTGGREGGCDHVSGVDVVTDHARLTRTYHAEIMTFDHLLRCDLEDAHEILAGNEDLGRNPGTTASDERLKTDLFVTAHIAFDPEVLKVHTTLLLHVSHQPLAGMPGAGSRHVLSCSITGFIDETNVNLVTD